MKKVPQFEEACEITGNDVNQLPNVEGLPETQAKRITADHKLSIIAKATNILAKFKPDFNNSNQLKWTGWLVYNPSLGAFVYTNALYTYTGTRLGARFWFKDGNTTREFTEQNIDLINDLHRSDD
ncbi:MAG: hypothetical protein ACXVAY_01525 [Mucilaginibacter sp.]